MKCANSSIGSKEVVLCENSKDMVIYWEVNYDACFFVVEFLSYYKGMMLYEVLELIFW